jgi:hypothetical protein
MGGSDKILLLLLDEISDRPLLTIIITYINNVKTIPKNSKFNISSRWNCKSPSLISSFSFFEGLMEI